MEQRIGEERRLGDESPRVPSSRIFRARFMLQTGIFVLLLLFALYFSRPFVLPILLAVIFSLLLSPLVRGLGRVGLPSAVGAGVVVLALLVTAGLGIYGLSGPAADWMSRAPRSLRVLEEKISFIRKPVEEVNKATEQMEEITDVGGDERTPEVEIKGSSFMDSVVSRTHEFLAGAVVTFALIYFFLASGDLFLRKIVKVLPRMQDKRRAVLIAREIGESISVYLITVTLINIVVGTVTGLVVYVLGMPNPVLWGVVAGLFNFIPYFGVMVNMAILASVALITFENVGEALLVPAGYLGIHLIEANLVTPKILGNRLALNPVAIFIGLTFWWWIWGIPGALLAVPILKMTKTVCDHVEPFTAIGELLGD